MDRILLGKNEKGTSGLWVSKPGVNAVAYASNGYYAGTDPGPDGLRDGKVLPIYGYNENFNFTGDSTYTHGFKGKDTPTTGGSIRVHSTENGTLRLVANISDPYYIATLNTSSFSGGSYGSFNSYPAKDRAFNGNNYPILEMRIRRPPKADGTHWKQADFNILASYVFEVFFHTSNATHLDRPDNGFSGTHSKFGNSKSWVDVFGEEGEWATLEYNFENNKWSYERGGIVTSDIPMGGNGGDWVSNTMIDAIRLDPGSEYHSTSEADWEIDYIRAKKRGIPINFGNSVDDNFAFSSDWFDTGLVHQTGVVTIGTEYAYANGASKPSGTSHAGSQSGRVDFPKLPYVPVVLFQRYDERNPNLNVSFPAGDKEFSSAHADVTSDVKVWNPLSKQYQDSSNTSYASEFRTFAYARSGYDHFDLTSRNAIARDGYEWLFNYTPQEPYIEIYKGGNYDPESENPESFVLYPQVEQMYHVGDWAHGSTFQNMQYRTNQGSLLRWPLRADNIDLSLSKNAYYINPVFNNSRASDIFSTFMRDAQVGISGESETDFIGHSDHVGTVSTSWTRNEYWDTKYVEQMPTPESLAQMGRGLNNNSEDEESLTSIYVPSLGKASDFYAHTGFRGGGDIGISSLTDIIAPLADDPSQNREALVRYLGINDSLIGWPAGYSPGLIRGSDPFIILPDGSKRYAGSSPSDAQTNELTFPGRQGSLAFIGEKHEEIINAGWFSDDASGGTSFAVGRMKPGVLGIRRGRIITTDNIPTEGFDQKEGRGVPYPAEINAYAFSSDGIIGSASYTSMDEALDYSARDYTDGKLGYFANFTGTDQGNCLPTFDWANKMGDWNVPQFNNFYQYDADIGAGSYVPFKDAIGTSWTEKNTKFLDDSMWLGYANNRFEYKGDIWHPQAPTKTYDELSGVFGYGSSIKNQGDWAHSAGFGYSDGETYGNNSRSPFHFFAWPQEGMTGIHAISRYDKAPYDEHLVGRYEMYGTGPFHPEMQFRNRYGYAPGNIFDAYQEENADYTGQSADAVYFIPYKYHSLSRNSKLHYPFQNSSDSKSSISSISTKYAWWDYQFSTSLSELSQQHRATFNRASKDFSSEIGFCGPGGAFLWSAPHDYGRMGAVSPSHTVNLDDDHGHAGTYSSEILIQRIFPPSIFWRRVADAGESKSPISHRFNIGTAAQRSGRTTGGDSSTYAEASGGLGRHGPWYPDEEGTPSSLGVFYDNYTHPFDQVVFDEYKRTSSRLGFGGDYYPDTKSNQVSGRVIGVAGDGRTAEQGKGFGRFPFDADGSSNHPLNIDSLISGYGDGWGAGRSIDREPTWTEPQTGYNGHKDSFVVSRWYTYPGATFSYDISNFSGPAHYNAWYKNDQTDEVQDYKRRDYPQLYTGGWGNYGYFPTQEQLDQGKGATRLFPDTKKKDFEETHSGGQYSRYYISFNQATDSGPDAFAGLDVSNYGSQGLITNPSGIPKYVTSWQAGGPNMIFKKTAILAIKTDAHSGGAEDRAPIDGGPDRRFETSLTTAFQWPGSSDVHDVTRAYFAPNHKHLDSQVSRTFGIPNEIAGDYYAASKRHNERGVHPDVTTAAGVDDSFLRHHKRTIDDPDGPGWLASSSNENYSKWIHSKSYGSSFFETAHSYTYMHPSFEKDTPFSAAGRTDAKKERVEAQRLTTAEYEDQKGSLPFADEKLRKYLLDRGIDLNKLKPGEAIPIKEDPFFAGMAFEGTNGITGAFNAHRFEFKIKKTKSHINHFRQSYEYNLPGRFPHRADTLRPIGYGLVSNHYGFDDLTSPPPAAHSYFDGRQLGGGHSYFQNRYNSYVLDYGGDYSAGRLPTLWPVYYESGVISDEAKDDTRYGHHPVNTFHANSWFGATAKWGRAIFNSSIRTGNPIGVFGTRFSDPRTTSAVPVTEDEDYAEFHPEAGYASYETAYDRELYTDPTITANGERGTFTRSRSDNNLAEQKEYAGQTGSAYYLNGTSTSISRHGRDSIVDNIIGAVEVANTYSADYKATVVDGGPALAAASPYGSTIASPVSINNWISKPAGWWSPGGGGADLNRPINTYYALGHKTLKYRPAKSQGASPETQMYSAYFGAPYNRWTDATPFFAGINSVYTSTANHWEGDILPGMCKADNALTNWGTVDLSKFDHNHIGYRWHNDEWWQEDPDGLKRAIIWSPSNSNTFFSEAVSADLGTDPQGRSLGTAPTDNFTGKMTYNHQREKPIKGKGRDYFAYHEDRDWNDSYTKRWTKYRITPHQKGGTYDGFSLHERPEFQPVSGDGRYFGGVGGVDNWGGTSYNTWGPGMSVSPTVWDLKWSGIEHPFNVSPSAEEDSNTFYNATSIENQTSYIGGAPNVRVLLGDNGGTFKYSNGTEVSGTGYDAANTWSATPMNYDWAIGGNQIQCNHWDRTLKIRDLKFDAGRQSADGTRRTAVHANNGIQPTVSLKIKACYIQGGTTNQVWVLENNGIVNSDGALGWTVGDSLNIANANEAGLDISDTPVTIIDSGLPHGGGGVQVTPSPPSQNDFAPILLLTTLLYKSDGTTPAETVEMPDNQPDPVVTHSTPQLVLYNKTLAENPSRHPTGAFKANTTYHFQYMYDETKINPPKYKYWVLRIPAGVDAYNGESLL